jgi:tripartite-type tricarboxylate transporter receptor subunit TctC
VARLLQQPLQAELGVPVVIENRGGASGALGTGQVARAAPDGQSFVLVFDTHATNPALIAQHGLRHPARPGAGLAARHRAQHAAGPPLAPLDQSRRGDRRGEGRPDAISYGTIGNGSLAHLGMVLAQRAGGFSVTHVPYRGGGPLATAAMSGETDLYAATGTIFVEHLRSGTLRPLAVLGPRRRANLPSVPTMAEAGLRGVEAQAFWGMLAPAATPQPIIARMEAAARRATEVPEVRERLSSIMGIEVLNLGGAAFGEFLDGQITTWARVIQENNIRSE